MYFVQTGVVLLLRDDIVMEVIMPGEFFGGDALLHLPTEEDLNRVSRHIHKLCPLSEHP